MPLPTGTDPKLTAQGHIIKFSILGSEKYFAKRFVAGLKHEEGEGPSIPPPSPWYNIWFPWAKVTATYIVTPIVEEDESGKMPGPAVTTMNVGPDVCSEIHPLSGAPVNAIGYEVWAYWRNHSATEKVVFNKDGTYTKTGAPFAKWRIVPPAGESVTDPTRLRIEEFRGYGDTSLYGLVPKIWNEYHHQKLGNGQYWQLNSANGSRQEIHRKTPLNGGVEETIVQVRDLSGLGGNHVSQPDEAEGTGGKIVSQTITTTDINGRTLVIAEGTGTDVLNTTFGYEAGADGKLISMIRSDGYFEFYFTYTSPGGAIVAGDYDATVTPFQGVTMAEAAASGITKGSVSLSKSLTVTGVTVTTSYELVQGSVISQTVSTSSDATVKRVAYRDWLPVHRTITERSGANLADGVMTSISETYSKYASASLVGLPAYRRNEDGTATIYHHYPKGSYDVVHDVFRQGQSGSYRNTYEMNYVDADKIGTQPTIADGLNIVTITDPQGREIRRATCKDDTVITHELNSYTGDGKLLTQKVDGVSTLSVSTYDAMGRVTSDKDEAGTTTTYSNFNTNDNPQTITRQGFSQSGELLPIPAQVRQVTYDSEGRTTSETSGGQTHSYAYDTRGRVKWETESAGDASSERTTLHSYGVGAGGRTLEVVTYPGGATQTTTTFADGQMEMTTGTAATTQSSERLLAINSTIPAALSGLSLGMMMEKEYIYGELTSARMVDGFGRVRADYIFSHSGTAPTGSWRTFAYDAAGRQISESVAGTVVRTTAYSGANMVVETLLSSPPQVHYRFSDYQYGVGFYWKMTVSDSGIQKELASHLAGVLSKSEYTDATGRISTQTTVTDGAGKTTQISTVPGVTGVATTISRGGLVQSQSAPGLAATLTGYDGAGRAASIFEPDGSTTAITYDPIYGQPATVTKSGGGVSTASMTTYMAPSSSSPGQVASQTVDGRTTNYTYTLDGKVATVSGATYPVSYGYDHAGRLTSLRTFRAEDSFPTGGDVTSWEYHSGKLTKKTDAGGHSVSYTYDNRGQMATSTNGRGLVTSYVYDLAGQVQLQQSYDGSPVRSFYYDELGRLNAQQQGQYEWTSYLYEGSSKRVISETMYSDNDFFGSEFGASSGEANLTRSYMSTGEVAHLGFSFAVVNSEQSPYDDHATQGYTYSPATGLLSSVGRSDWVAFGGLHDHSVVFGRDAAGRVSGWSHGVTGGVSLDTLQTPDGIGRTKRVETTAAGAAGSFTEYSYSGGQRQTAETDQGKWSYSYNARGEVLSGTKGIGNTVVPGYRFGYNYDAIGNLTSRDVNNQVAIYTTNSLNQYTQRTVPGFLDVRGWRSGATTGSTAEVRLFSTAGQALSDWVDARPFVGGYFAANVPLDNTAGPRIANVEVRSTAMAGQPAQEVEVKETRRAVLAKTPEVLAYDGDGNLASDGLWSYSWDAQNRLQWAVRQAGTAVAGDATMVHYAYDHLGRRVGKIVYSGPATVKSKTIYFYDGWNLIYESKISPRNGNGAADTRVTRQYTWGLDLSGTPQGAGGVGGLVGVSLVEAIRDQPGLDEAHLHWRILQDISLVPAYDGNGNIVAYRNAGTGAVEQEEEYGPFGESLRPRPESALRSPFGWSTKYTDEETGLVYYGYRYYSSSLGRWVSRDPIGERGGLNRNAFVANCPLDSIDMNGLWKEPQRKGEVWAEIEAEENDTWDKLARYVLLEYSERKLWIKNYEENPNPCKKYQIPNTVVVYTRACLH